MQSPRQPARPTLPGAQAACAWLGRLWLAALLALGLVGGAACAQGPEPEDGAHTITRVQMWSDTTQAWDTPVQLPANWRAGQADWVRLRADLNLLQAPTEMWALRFERLPPDHDLLVNGQRLHGRPHTEGPTRRFSQKALWIDVPPALLKAGHNSIEFSFDLNLNPGGVSPLQIGPAHSLYDEHRRAAMLGESLPYSLNMASAGLSLFTLLVWWQRRSEKVLGFFGGLWLLMSVRNMAYYVDGGFLPGPLSDTLLFFAQCISVGLIASFALNMTTLPRWRRWAPAVAPVVALLLALGAVAGWHDGIAQARLWVYPLLLVTALVSFMLLAHAARGQSLGVRRLMVFSLGLAIVAAVHDYLFNSGVFSVMGRYWLPYVVPSMMMLATLMLLKRLVSAFDMAERHGLELEQRVAERTHELQQANAAKTRFIAAASHDLRQPVASIGLLTSVLKEQLSGRAAMGVVARLTESVLALEQLLKGLLDLSRFDAGSVQVQPRQVLLQPLFDAVAAHEQDAASAKGICLRLRGGGLAVHTDPVLLEQIVRNLVSNAVRYTRQGGVLVSARRRGRSQVLLQVWDTGCGIPAERQASVFDEYVQFDPHGENASRGLGLGLALVRRAAALLQVPLALRSVHGQGSCFSVLLPAALAPVRPEPLAEPLPLGLKGRRILLVDDDEGVREALGLRLQSWGALVQPFASVHGLAEGLAGGQVAERPDLLISDQRLPDGDSRLVADVLSHRHAGVPMLVVTGNTAPADLAVLHAAGWPVLHKPFSADALFAALLAALRRTEA